MELAQDSTCINIRCQPQDDGHATMWCAYVVRVGLDRLLQQLLVGNATLNDVMVLDKTSVVSSDGHMQQTC